MVTYILQLRSVDQMVEILWLKNTDNFMLFYTCDLDLDPVTLVPKLYLDIIVTVTGKRVV